MKTSEFITADQDARYRRTQAKGDTPCEMCGKPLANYNLYLAEDRNGELVLATEPYNEIEHITLYIGSECARRAALKPYVRRVAP